MLREGSVRHLPVIAAKQSSHAAFMPRGERGPEAFPKPVYCVWEVTLRCDLSCRHCGSRAGHPRADELSTAEALDAVRQMADLGIREVTLIGGEAYLRDDWLEIVRAIRAAGMTPNMTTGGRGITREMAVAAYSAGLRLVSVSIDGLEPAHDEQRGVKGSFRAALETIDHLHAAGIKVGMNTQINRVSRNDLPALVDLMIARHVRLWQVQFTVLMGRAADQPEMVLQPYDLLEVVPLLASLKERCTKAGIGVWPANNVGYYGPHEADLWGDRRAGHAAVCSAGNATMGLEANGDVKGCPSLATEDFVGGNLRTRSLREIWQHSPELRHTREREVAELWGYCAECYYGEVCRAGCTWTAHSLFGRPGNNPYCHHRAIELERRGVREVVRPVARAPGTPFDHGLYELHEEPIPR